MRDLLLRLLQDKIPVNNLPDVEWLLKYINDGCPFGDPIILSIGETWTNVPAPLISNLINAPAETHGYQLSMFGLPSLRKKLRKYLIKSHKLPIDSNNLFEVAVTWSGTRSSMFDFGRFLKNKWAGHTVPIALATAPGWDYAGVFEPLGFQMAYLHLNSNNSFEPALEDFNVLTEKLKQEKEFELALIIINAQHNPTGINWSPNFVRSLIKYALSEGIGILIDDAYFGVHSPSIVPTSALTILLEEILLNKETPSKDLWLAVRSLGKQFNCNGWALGGITASIDTLNELVNNLRIQHQYNYLGLLQYVMSNWLEDPNSEAFLVSEAQGYEEKKSRIKQLLQTKLNFPLRSVHIGECTPYLLFSIPKIYIESANTKAFLKDCFYKTGVMFSNAWALPRVADMPSINYIRMFLGPNLSILEEAIERMQSAGLTYDMQTKINIS